MSDPLEIAVFSTGLVLVIPESASNIQKYESDGDPLGNFAAYVYGGCIALDDSDDYVFINDPGTSAYSGIRIYTDLGSPVGRVTTAALGTSKIFANVKGMTFGGGCLYFVNEDGDFPENYGDDLLVRIERAP